MCTSKKIASRIDMIERRLLLFTVVQRTHSHHSALALRTCVRTMQLDQRHRHTRARCDGHTRRRHIGACVCVGRPSKHRSCDGWSNVSDNQRAARKRNVHVPRSIALRVTTSERCWLRTLVVRAVLCRAVPCRAVPCRAVPCRAMFVAVWLDHVGAPQAKVCCAVSKSDALRCR